MKLIFTKGSGKHDVLEVLREGREPERIECPKQGIIPHDMVHYAVEHTLNARGFLGRIKDGDDGGFRMKQEAETDSVERLVEVFQGDGWSGGTTPAADVIDLYRVTCVAKRCSALPLDEAAVHAVRSAIAELTNRWNAVETGSALQLQL